MDSIVNIAGYRFVDLPDRDALQAPFQKVCAEQELKGTILLSPEGINFFLAGLQNQIDAFVAHLEQDDRFAGIELKISHSDYQPFRRMNVRLKNEIISLGLDHIRPADPQERRSRRLSLISGWMKEKNSLCWILETTTNALLERLRMPWNWIFKVLDSFHKLCPRCQKS